MNPNEHPLGVADRQMPRFLAEQEHQPDAPLTPSQRTRSPAGFMWEPARRREDIAPANWPRRLAEATPASSVLLRWAASPTNQPPRTWWDDTTDPFTADAD